MKAPSARIDSATASPTPNSYVAHTSWSPYQNEDEVLLGYKLQMREDAGSGDWSTVAQCLSGTEVRKKNLTSKYGYMFRVRPVLRGEPGGSESNLGCSVSEGGNVVPFSCVSGVVGARKERGSSGGATSNDLLKLFKKLPNDTLLAKGGMDKVCCRRHSPTRIWYSYTPRRTGAPPPCRKYTPQLIKFYNDTKHFYKQDPKRTRSVEIVFVSADHDMSGFKNYYATMPWLAVPFDADTRERLMSWMKVTGVPRLMVLDGRTGKTLESNAVGRALDLARFAKMVK